MKLAGVREITKKGGDGTGKKHEVDPPSPTQGRVRHTNGDPNFEGRRAHPTRVGGSSFREQAEGTRGKKPGGRRKSAGEPKGKAQNPGLEEGKR